MYVISSSFEVLNYQQWNDIIGLLFLQNNLS